MLRAYPCIYGVCATGRTRSARKCRSFPVHIVADGRTCCVVRAPLYVTCMPEQADALRKDRRSVSLYIMHLVSDRRICCAVRMSRDQAGALRKRTAAPFPCALYIILDMCIC